MLECFSAAVRHSTHTTRTAIPSLLSLNGWFTAMTFSAHGPGSTTARPDRTGARAMRLDSLTGLRWVAAFAVFLNHVATLLPVPHTHALFALGSSGVTFFFVLSGFVLTWTARDGDRVGAFYGRRFARIWPMLAVGALLAFALQLPDAPDGQAHRLTVILISSVLLYQAWVPGWILGGTSPVTWSLACEAFFYALFPLLSRFVLRRSLRRLAGAAVALLLVGWGIRLWLWHVYPPQARPPFTGVDGMIFGTYAPVARLWEFLLGMVAAAAMRRGARSPLTVRWAAALLGAGLLVLWLCRDQAWRSFIGYDVLSQVTAPLYALLVMALAARDLAGGRSWLRSRPMVRLGEWSYAFYLLHFTVLFEIATTVLDRGNIAEFYLRPVPESWSNAGWALLALAISASASALLYLVYERPVEIWLRARLSTRERRG